MVKILTGCNIISVKTTSNWEKLTLWVTAFQVGDKDSAVLKPCLNAVASDECVSKQLGHFLSGGYLSHSAHWDKCSPRPWLHEDLAVV